MKLNLCDRKKAKILITFFVSSYVCKNRHEKIGTTRFCKRDKTHVTASNQGSKLDTNNSYSRKSKNTNIFI